MDVRTKILVLSRFRGPDRRFCLGVPKPGCFKPGCLQFLCGSALKCSSVLFCSLLCSLADLRLRSFALICTLLCAFACFCVQQRLERPRLGSADSFCPRMSTSMPALTFAGHPAPKLALWAAFSFLNLLSERVPGYVYCPCPPAEARR